MVQRQLGGVVGSAQILQSISLTYMQFSMLGSVLEDQCAPDQSAKEKYSREQESKRRWVGMEGDSPRQQAVPFCLCTGVSPGWV